MTPGCARGRHVRAGAHRCAVLALAVLFAAGCGQAPAGTGVITLAVPSSPNSFDPRVATDEISQKVAQLVYDNLLTLDERRATGKVLLIP